MLLAIGKIHQSPITLKPLTVKVNNSICLQCHPWRGKIYWAASEQSVLEIDALEAGRMVKNGLGYHEQVVQKRITVNN